MQTCSAPLSCCVSSRLTQVQFKRRWAGAIKEPDRKASNKPPAAPADRGTSVMSFWPSNTKKFEHSRPIIECSQCGEWLFGPEWSEYIDERYVRHLWKCEHDLCRRRGAAVADDELQIAQIHEETTGVTDENPIRLRVQRTPENHHPPADGDNPECGRHHALAGALGRNPLHHKAH